MDPLVFLQTEDRVLRLAMQAIAINVARIKNKEPKEVGE